MPRFLSSFRSKDKDNDASSNSGSGHGFRSKSRSQNELAKFRPDVWVPPGSHRLAGYLDEKILERIFHFVSPHSSDDRYRSSEESAGTTGDGCVLCETRDLAACMRVSRTWYHAAEKKLYRSIRFESVHYCEREDWLRDHRKNKHKPEEIDQLRLRLIERTLTEYPQASTVVEVLKFPYQIREGYKADLARIVTHTPNLKYADLPEGVYSDQQSSLILKQQLMTRCPDLRFMKYKAGGEATFARHSFEDLWYNLEAVSLQDMDLEPDVLLYSLARLLNLSKLNLSNTAVVTDQLLQPSPSLPALPAVRTLKIADAPTVTAKGLFAYMERPEVVATITTLQLENTGVQVQDIHRLLAVATRLRTFTIKTKVIHAMQPGNVPPLASRSLRQIYFEISNDHSHGSVGNMPCDSYYDYLASSIASRSLPSLRSVRTYCPQFPDLLVSLAPLPGTHFTAGGADSLASPGLLSAGFSPISPPSQNMPPRLSAKPGSFPTSALPSPALPPSLANRMSTMSLGPGSGPGSLPGAPVHGRSQSHAAPLYNLPGAPAATNQRPSSSYGMGYSQSPFSPSLSELQQASAAEPSVPPDIVARLGLIGGGLTIYTKPPNAEEMEWLVTELVPPSPGVAGRPGVSGGIRGARPISLMPGGPGVQVPDQDLSWLAGPPPSGSASRSGIVGSHGGQLVGNGFGGFIEVKDEGKKGRRKGNEWMG